MTVATRRDVLKWAGAAGALAGASGLLGACATGRAGVSSAEPTAPVAAPAAAAAEESPPLADLEFTLKAVPAEVALLPGQPTRVWTYQAELLKGDPASVQALPGSYLGPIIRVRRGQTVGVRFVNHLPAPDQKSIVHWHGLRLPEEMDGHPRFAIDPGQAYAYAFRVEDRAATYWFHPHPHGLTAAQVMMGLAGLFIVSDEEESAAGLPAGAQDVPLVIQDRVFDRDNQLIYLGGAAPAATHGMNRGGMMGGMREMGDMNVLMEQAMGFLGDRILVNGIPDFTLPVAARPYRLRLLNGSNSRIYKLAWSDGAPLTVIGTDGGLLDAPVQRPYVTLAPGERAEVWADFSGRAGQELALNSLAFSGADSDSMGGMAGMMDHGMMGHGDMGEAQGMDSMAAARQALPLGAPFTVMTVRVAPDAGANASDVLQLPERLAAAGRHRLEDVVNRSAPRVFKLTQQAMAWQINGRAFEMDAVAGDERVTAGDLEVWEFDNALNPGEMMHPLGMAHPIHIHGAQFQVIDRQMLPDLRAGWDTVREGYVDEGWKDTFLLMPGERVKLLLKFGPHTGRFVFHCHNLEHESQGMMRNYEVRA